MPNQLLRKPNPRVGGSFAGAPGESGVISKLSAAEAGWQMLNFEARQLERGQHWEHDTASNEMCVVVLGGRCSVESAHGNWAEVGRRENVFDGMPYAFYFSRNSRFTIKPLSQQLVLAAAWVATSEDHPAHLITPDDSLIEIRGGHNATRQINSILPPGSDCQRLVCVEVYTPSGNWSSYPPHKHDKHVLTADGQIAEADLEEIYFYQFSKPGGWAFQRVYNDERTLDEALTPQHNDMVLVPEGYHPVATAYGYDCYYLNFLAGSAQSLAATFDPQFDWTRETWDVIDSRVPLVNHKMEQKVLS